MWVATLNIPKGKEYKNIKEYGPCWFTARSKYYMHLYTWERIKKKETICGLSKFLKCQPPLLLLIFGCCAASGGKRRAVNKSRSWRHHHLDIHRYFISLYMRSRRQHAHTHTKAQQRRYYYMIEILDMSSNVYVGELFFFFFFFQQQQNIKKNLYKIQPAAILCVCRITCGGLIFWFPPSQDFPYTKWFRF